MSKQEKIREGIQEIELGVDDLHGILEGHTHLTAKGIDKILRVEDKLGVVIKIAEIEEHLAQVGADSDSYSAYGVGASWERNAHMFKAFKGAGYVAVKPLITKED